MPRVNLSRRSVKRIDRLKAHLIAAMSANQVTNKAISEALDVSEQTVCKRLHGSSTEWKLGDILTILDLAGADSVELSFVCGVGDDGRPQREVVRL